MGEVLVIDTLIRAGRYIGSLSTDSYVIAEQVGYRPKGDTTKKREEMPFFMVSAPGIVRFDKGFSMEAIGFDTEVPYMVYEKHNPFNKWDIKALNDVTMRAKLGLPEYYGPEEDYERDE